MVTAPSEAGVLVAFIAEVGISFGMMLMVLFANNTRRLARYTGLFAGLLVALYITFESPLSGMSMNPARSLASALPSGHWTAFWIYLIAPPLGMLLAAQAYLTWKGRHAVHCAKLHHQNDKRCIFCDFQAGK